MIKYILPCRSGDFTKTNISGRILSETRVRATGCNFAMVVRRLSVNCAICKSVSFNNAGNSVVT